MATAWREVLEELEIPTSNAAGPGGAGGDWQQLAAAFGTKAFLRALTDGDALAIECVPPGDPAGARGALREAGWAIEGEDVPFVARRDFPEDVDSLRPHWVSIAKLADATRDEDADAFVAALVVSEPIVEEESRDEAGNDPEHPPQETATAAAFEPIGDASPRPALDRPFAYVIGRDGGVVEAKLGFDEPLDKHVFEKLEARLVGNLRGKYDVDVKVVGAREVAVKLAVEPKTRIALRIEPAPIGADTLSVRDVEERVTSYFENLDELAGSGIDPLVFLGVRASKRNTGAFESIGSHGAKPLAQATPEEDEGETVLFVEDDVSDDGADSDEGEVVFGGEPLDADAPLEPARYDDERLKRPDATTTLVDVILRHPGYSDRSIGQVLSILLSLDYASCLDIAERAPTVVAWGVARDRALTMKTVIEGAGGKVVLVEPGTFGED